MDIEKEIQARVEFKLNHILDSIKNRAKINWHISLNETSQKYCHYWEAFTELEKMFLKEINMPVLVDYMAELKDKENLDKAKEKIMDRFCKRGERDYHQKEKMLVGVLENLLNYKF